MKVRNIRFIKASEYLSSKEVELLGEYAQMSGSENQQSMIDIKNFISDWAMNQVSFDSLNKLELAKKNGAQFVSLT